MAFTKKPTAAADQKTGQPSAVDNKDQQPPTTVTPPVIEEKKTEVKNDEKEAKAPKKSDAPKQAPYVPEADTKNAPKAYPVNNEKDALKLFKKDYSLPEGDEFAYVAQDGNVFFKSNEGSALAHAKAKGIQLFAVKP